MRIVRAECRLLHIPLNLRVRHALAERSETANLIVRLEDEAGNSGWGEGVPREYVTGETPEGAFRALAEEILPALPGRTVNGPSGAPALIAECLESRDGEQSSRCAAELALLDLAGKRFGRSAMAWCGGPRRRTLIYGAVLPLMEREERIPFLSRIRDFGIGHLKIKAEAGEVLEALDDAREILGPGAGLCVDANGSWDLSTALRLMPALESRQVKWVEQPLPRGREEEIPLLAARGAVPIMVDESLTTEVEAARLIERGGCGLFNIRLSKVGGMMAAHRIATQAAEAGVKVQVGCQVGETAILAAAGRLLGASLPAVEIMEGSYGRRLLSTDLGVDTFEFGRGGEALLQEGDGLGLPVDDRRIEILTVRCAHLD
jgi:muconate cycloisomerase